MTTGGTELQFPDVHRKLHGKATDEEKKAVAEENKRSARLYSALKVILKEDFNFHLPATAAEFPGELSRDEQARYLAIHGIMLADNLSDPSFGKDAPVAGDRVLPAEGKDIVIAQRFSDAVVAAVQEFTSQAELYRKVFNFLAASGKTHDGVSSTPSSAHAAK
jgi:hypothetical protein